MGISGEGLIQMHRDLGSNIRYIGRKESSGFVFWRFELPLRLIVCWSRKKNWHW